MTRLPMPKSRFSFWPWRSLSRSLGRSLWSGLPRPWVRILTASPDRATSTARSARRWSGCGSRQRWRKCALRRGIARRHPPRSARLASRRSSLHRFGRSGGFLDARFPPGPTSVMGEPGWCVLHQSLASGRVLNFIGSTSGPLTTKWPLIIRMVSVVIALALPNLLRSRRTEVAVRSSRKPRVWMLPILLIVRLGRVQSRSIGPVI